MKVTLATLLQSAHKELQTIDMNNPEAYLSWVDKFPAQLSLLAQQLIWSESIEKTFVAGGPLSENLAVVENTINILAANIMSDLPIIRRKKYEILITELVHQRDVTRKLVRARISSASDFNWLYEMRFYWNDANPNMLKKFTIQMANTNFYYGYEYLGVGEKLVQTPLTDRCYLTLTQALDARLGGNPFGPAGTGKTETVKALGWQLGRFVLVFCCDENFDFQAMGRIFVDFVNAVHGDASMSSIDLKSEFFLPFLNRSKPFKLLSRNEPTMLSFLENQFESKKTPESSSR